MLIKINTDNYFITQRIKEIDKHYFIVFNTTSNKFEIHNERQAENTYCVGLPFIELDERTIDFVLKTQASNVEKIIEEIEKNNKKIEEKNKEKIIEELEEII